MITRYLTTKQQKKEERKAWALVIIEGILVLTIAVFTILTLTDIGLAEDMQGRQCWILCQPDGIVNIREKPKKTGIIFGGAMCGTDLLTDGKTRNGFLHVYDIPAEENEGWVSARYIVYDEPEEVNCPAVIRAEGRVACRKWPAGKITGWVYDGDTVTVYWMSEEWSVTSRGYIMTEFLEVPQG